ncbi:MAG: hypothetical protein AAF449_22235, partial [Myxococcota bacterium]
DKLSDLPPKTRARYAKRAAKKAQKRAELEAAVGKREADRREAEAERQKNIQRQIAEAQRAQQRQDLQRVLNQIKKDDKAEASRKAKWKKRVADARAEVDRLFAEFKKTRKAYDNIAVRANFALFPGQAKEKEKLRKRLDELEKELDAALDEQNNKIPNEARKAGVPPGWIR